jgi:hypothetical protein
MRWAAQQATPGGDDTGQVLPDTKADERRPDTGSGYHKIGSGLF